MSAPAPAAVFLSYASQDAEAARRICESLRRGGIEVWFDADGGLEHGDEWDLKIRRQIKDCIFFLPLISANTQARLEGYFRIEWELAAQRALGIAAGVPFILPVVIDDTREPDALVPERFRAVQWMRLPGGVVPPETQARLLKLWSHRIGALKATAGTAPAYHPPELAEAPAKKSPAPLAIAAAALLVLAAGGGWWLSQRAPASTTASAQKEATPAPITLPPISEKSLVVLPLENLSPDPADAFFTDGMHLELISTLGRISDLKVLSRNTALTFKGANQPATEFAQKIGAANFITGSVRRAGGTVRIALELRATRDETLLWTKTYDKDASGALAVQTEIAEEVARVLQTRGTSGLRAAQFMAKNPEAYERYLKALAASMEARRPTLATTEEFIRKMEEIAALDPGFLPAVSFVSEASTQAYLMSPDPAAKLRHAQNAKRWAEATSRLAPGPFGNQAWAYYYTNIETDNARSLALAEGAVRAQPNSAGSYRYLGLALCSAGRFAEALAAFRREREFETGDPSSFAVERMALAALRRTDEWLALAKSIEQSSPKAVSVAQQTATRFALTGEVPATLPPGSTMSRGTWLLLRRQFGELVDATDKQFAKKAPDDARALNPLEWKSQALRRLGRAGEAADAGRLMVPIAEKLVAEPAVDPTANLHWLARALMCAGRPDEAIATGRRFVDAASPTNQVNMRWQREERLAELYAWAGRPRECVELLAKILRRPGLLTVHVLRVSPEWDDVRNDPAFKTLLADPKNAAPL